MTSHSNPNHAPVAQLFAVVSVSVSTSGSAAAAGVGSFRGLFFRTTSSVTIVGNNNNSITIDAAQKNSFIWIQGEFCSAIGTATAIYALQ